MDSLLPYFEHELTLFNKQSKEFAKKYPKIANRLLMAHDTVDDPHIERLIQAFSLISARINKKLDDSYADFTESLLSVLYPDYIKPFPSLVYFSNLTLLRMTFQNNNSTRGGQKRLCP